VSAPNHAESLPSASTRKMSYDNRTVYGFAFAAQDTVIGVLPPGSHVALDGVVVSANATGSCVCSSSSGGHASSGAERATEAAAAATAMAGAAMGANSARTCKQTDIQYGVKYSRGDFRQVALPANLPIADNAATCSRACCEDAMCQAWTYAVADSAFGVCAVGSGCCYLKNATSRLSPRPDAASGTPHGGGEGGFCACAWRSTDGNILTRLSFDGNASHDVPTSTSVQHAVSARLALLCGLTPPAHVPADQHWLFYKAVSTMNTNALGPGGNLNGTAEADGRLTWGSAVFGWSQPMYAAAWRFAAPHLPIAEELFETYANVVAVYGMEPHETTPTTVDVRLTNPPLLAWAAWEAYQRANDTNFLRRVYPALATYLTWDMIHRDTNNNSLLEWSVSFESGLDLSPRFDDGSEFDAVDFSSYAAHDALRLADIAAVLELDADRSTWLALADSISNAVHALLWDDRDGCYRDRFKNGSLSDVDSLPNFAPLLLPSTPAVRVASMAARLRSPCYQTRWLFPTVSTCDRRFEVDCMRGGLWPALNWIFGEGLHNSGLDDLARELDNSTVEVIRTTALRLGPLYEFFDPTGQTPPDRVQRKGRHNGGSRDVAWTAASLLAVMARLAPQ
jgi:hypothetical protein